MSCFPFWFRFFSNLFSPILLVLLYTVSVHVCVCVDERCCYVTAAPSETSPTKTYTPITHNPFTMNQYES